MWRVGFAKQSLLLCFYYADKLLGWKKKSVIADGLLYLDLGRRGLLRRTAELGRAHTGKLVNIEQPRAHEATVAEPVLDKVERAVDEVNHNDEHEHAEVGPNERDVVSRHKRVAHDSVRRVANEVPAHVEPNPHDDEGKVLGVETPARQRPVYERHEQVHGVHRNRCLPRTCPMHFQGSDKIGR
jgi:hypothetical protein